jgi:hypothetical protein
MIHCNFDRLLKNVEEFTSTFRKATFYYYHTFSHAGCEYIKVLLAKAAEGRLSAHLQQITRFHLSMLLTNQIMAFHSTEEVLLAKAAEGRLSAHLQQFTCSIYLYQTENWRFPNVSY